MNYLLRARKPSVVAHSVLCLPPGLISLALQLVASLPVFTQKPERLSPTQLKLFRNAQFSDNHNKQRAVCFCKCLNGHLLHS